MGEVAQEISLFEDSHLHDHDHDHERPTMIKTPEQQLIITINESPCSGSSEDVVLGGTSYDDWLPITESRNGNTVSVIFHLLCSGIGFQALTLPAAFPTLGWTWGIICLSLAFSWQLYTIWVLVHLSETPQLRPPGTRHSRYLRLAIAAFGPTIGKLLAIFPVIYLSGGSCVMLIITAGGNIERFFMIICGGGGGAKSLPSGVVCFLMFTCMAILISQLPNLNSIAKVSMIGAITAVGSCTLIWVLSIKNGGRLDDDHHVPYHHPAEMARSEDMDKFADILNAIGIIVLAFRGHNLVLEIQGTLPSNSKHPTSKTMWRGVTISYLIIAMTLFPLAITGFWAYGNKVTANGGMLSAFWLVHGDNTSKLVLGTMYLLAVINSLSSYPIYAMPTFDNWEFLYVSTKQKQCPRRVRVCLRLFFGGLTFFIAVAFPFLRSLAPLLGGITLPLTYAYPCFMYISIRKPSRNGGMWWLNMGLGCLGTILSVVLVVVAVWNLASKGLHANFFRP